MISQEKQELLQLVTQMWERYPDWRLGQLIANLADLSEADLWDAENEQLIAGAKRHLEYQRSIAAAREAELREWREKHPDMQPIVHEAKN